jgi:hypothetical protein
VQYQAKAEHLNFNDHYSDNIFEKGFSPMQNARVSIIPSRVNSSFLTKMRIGFLIKQEVTSSTSEGIVADNRMTWKQRITILLLFLPLKSYNEQKGLTVSK